MKLIPLTEGKTFKAVDILSTVMGSSPTNSVNVNEMRQRVRVLDAIEARGAATEIRLEDADYELLSRVLSAFPFSVAHKELLGIIDDVLNAKDVPTAPAKAD